MLEGPPWEAKQEGTEPLWACQRLMRCRAQAVTLQERCRGVKVKGLRDMGHQSKMVDFDRLGLDGPACSGMLCVLGEADKAENDSLCRWQAGGRGASTEARGTRNSGPQLGCSDNSVGKEAGKYELRASLEKRRGRGSTDSREQCAEPDD